MSVALASVEGLKVAVLGAGLMGSKIGRLFARCGADVSFVDAHDDLALAAAADVRTSLGDELRGEVRALALVAAVAQADLVVEAVTERLEVKAAVLREVAAVSDTVPIASNTSTYQPSELQQMLTAPDRLLVAHFFNPADVVPLVEVVPGPATSRCLVEDVVRLLRALGKRPVILNQECPGFVANRLQAAVLRAMPLS